MGKLTGEEIELINAHGPFNHSVWTSEDTEVSNEERLSGRGEYLVNLLRKTITERFSDEELSGMTIADIGCYDAWILHQLSDLPFKRLVGVEPRQKNIDKGVFIRDAMGISSRVELVRDDLKILNNQSFDIVLCIGVIHHLESITNAIKVLRNGTKQFLFIETICLSSKYITKGFKREIEMKDIAYRYKERLCGISGQKFESSYYDGSAMDLSVVSIPSIETIMMSLNINFEEIRIEADPEAYSAAFKKYDRNFNAVCISAKPQNAENEESNWFKSYEEEMTEVTLKRCHIEPMYNKIHGTRNGKGQQRFPLLFSLYLCNDSYISKTAFWFLKNTYRSKPEQEIIRNIKYNIPDKISFEYGKLLFHNNDLKSSISVLKELIQKINADWRCVYRSFYLLSLAYDKLNLREECIKYRKLFKLSNPSLGI